MSDFEMRLFARPRRFKSDKLSKMLKSLGELPGLMDRIGQTLTLKIQRNISGRLLNKRSGRLHDSWTWLTEPTAKGWRVAVGSDVVYARIHDLGGRTGRDHNTRIHATHYVSIAFRETRVLIRRLGRDFLTSITRT